MTAFSDDAIQFAVNAWLDSVFESDAVEQHSSLGAEPMTLIVPVVQRFRELRVLGIGTTSTPMRKSAAPSLRS